MHHFENIVFFGYFFSPTIKNKAATSGNAWAFLVEGDHRFIKNALSLAVNEIFRLFGMLSMMLVDDFWYFLYQLGCYYDMIQMN